MKVEKKYLNKKKLFVYYKKNYNKKIFFYDVI